MQFWLILFVRTGHKGVSKKAADNLPTERGPVMSIYCRRCGSYKRSNNYYEFYAYHSVHRESILKKVPTRWHFVQYFIISCKSLYMFRA
jgi:hypothetical protein